MDTTNLRGLAYDAKELAEGAKIGSRYAGMYLALVSAGMEDDMAHAICINESTSKNNIEVAKLGAFQQQSNGTIQRHKCREKFLPAYYKKMLDNT